jgi:hypothetical protein
MPAEEIEKNGKLIGWVIRVYSSGSFSPEFEFVTKAIDHGHAYAVRMAIKELTDQILPAAIRQDVQLREKGATPARGWLPEDMAAMDEAVGPPPEPQRG